MQDYDVAVIGLGAMGSAALFHLARRGVKAVGIERFTLFLNDDLVDLDKEITFVVNDKATVEPKKTRSFRDMQERLLLRRDWEYIFPVVYHTTVPKADPKADPNADPKK